MGRKSFRKAIGRLDASSSSSRQVASGDKHTAVALTKAFRASGSPTERANPLKSALQKSGVDATEANDFAVSPIELASTEHSAPAPVPAPAASAPAAPAPEPAASAETAPEATASTSDSAQPVSTETNQPINQQLLAMVQSNLIAPLQQQLQASQVELETLRSASAAQAETIANQNQQLAQTAASQGLLQDLSKLVGGQFGAPSAPGVVAASGDLSTGRFGSGINFNTQISGGDKVIGSLKDFEAIQREASLGTRMSPNGTFESVSNTHLIDEFVKAERSHIKKDLETTLRKSGLLRGSTVDVNTFTAAATTAADIVGGFLPVISALMRENNRAGYIFHQFMTTRFNFTQGGGGAVDVPRAAYQPAPTDPADRQLSGLSTYAAITNTSQALATGTVPIRIQEWGLGKNAGAAPIAIPTFVSAWSMLDLMEILDRNIWQDYIRWEDLKARSLWLPTSRVIFNKGDRPTTDATSIGAGEGGTCTHRFLQSIADYMYEEEIPTLADGCYGYAAPVRHLSTIRDGLDEKLAPPTAEDVQMITNYLNATTGGAVDRVSGYQGKIGNMHVFSSNGWGKGAPGADGVQNDTFGSAAIRTTYTGFAFGSNTVARGIGRDFNIRVDEHADFNRLHRVIWQEESGWAPLDVDPVGYLDASAVPQQLRVLEVRCTADPV